MKKILSTATVFYTFCLKFPLQLGLCLCPSTIFWSCLLVFVLLPPYLLLLLVTNCCSSCFSNHLNLRDLSLLTSCSCWTPHISITLVFVIPFSHYIPARNHSTFQSQITWCKHKNNTVIRKRKSYCSIDVISVSLQCGCICFLTVQRSQLFYGS